MRTTIMMLVVAGSVLPGCERSPGADEGAAAPVLRPTAADSAAVVAAAEPIATAVAQGLAGRLQAQIAAGGAAGAVDFCATTALALTDSLARVAGAGVEVKRTSTRLGNALNSPDALEREALAWFDSARARSGALPAHYVQAGPAGEMRYYRPLVIAPLCTQCHGDPATMDSAVVRVLGERYPDDRATGYREGDLRGVLRVSLPRASG